MRALARLKRININSWRSANVYRSSRVTFHGSLLIARASGSRETISRVRTHRSSALPRDCRIRDVLFAIKGVLLMRAERTIAAIICRPRILARRSRLNAPPRRERSVIVNYDSREECLSLLLPFLIAVVRSWPFTMPELGRRERWYMPGGELGALFKERPHFILLPLVCVLVLWK